MRGASAIQDALREVPNLPLRVLVVWEPVLATDVAPPTNRVLARVLDRRAVQFWDEDRLISREILRASPSGAASDPDAEDGEIVWDYVAIHPAGSRWEGGPPPPDFEGGTVVEVIEEVRSRLGAESEDRSRPVAPDAGAAPPKSDS